MNKTSLPEGKKPFPHDEDELLAMMLPGVKFCYGLAPRSRTLYHVCAVVDNTRVVVKWYSKIKQRWVYEVIGIWTLSLWAEYNRIFQH